ncbi:hypothetical protein HA402_002788 [Bradysia odoriphaga]|nr:hypothetical protein HA402_002788 [Bradysia odoriphaga]
MSYSGYQTKSVLNYDCLVAIFENLTDQDLINYCIATSGTNDKRDKHYNAAVREYYIHKVSVNGLNITSDVVPFLLDNLIPVFKDEIQKGCHTLRLLLGDDDYTTREQLRYVLRPCYRIGLTNLRTIFLQGRLDCLPYELITMVSFLKTVTRITFDCEFRSTFQSAKEANREFWTPISRFIDENNDNNLHMYFNRAKLTPAYEKMLQAVNLQFVRVHMHFF